jgi:excisionase family DNA binding protein
MKDRERVCSYEDLPLVLNVADIQRIMGISRVSAYELVHQRGFPAVKSGRLIKIGKRAFFDWLESGGMGCRSK